MSVTVKAYAKINLLLDILRTLPDGYHDLYMIMQSVSLYDKVTVSKTDTGKIEILCDNYAIPTDNRNIAYKAAVHFFDYIDKENPGIEITLEKNIPHAAGLAGGSADGAAVVTALNKLFDVQLSDRQVLEICSRFGSDVAFCALGGTMAAQGTGNVLTYMPQMKIDNIVIVKPDCSVSTAQAYSAFDTAEHIRHLDRTGAFDAVMNADLDALCSRVDNVFEQFIDVPQRVPIKAAMRRHGAKCACMSGSGPSVFGIFEKEEDARRCAEELKEQYPNTYLCSSMPFGCEIV